MKHTLVENRWAIGLALGFLMVVVANVVLVVFALDEPDPIVPSYETEAR
ncbi:MAG: hypothetical protein GY913_15945 [Proteobacteria bacterium]|nr:hypothetical protein [Pseudomonadota bacterium]MCP4918398.1 hypothetical protein [Pseudomonadota bacterium]